VPTALKPGKPTFPVERLLDVTQALLSASEQNVRFRTIPLKNSRLRRS
jgi:hypothetical protein